MRKKATDEPDDPGLRAEYDFKLSPRGTPALRFREASIDERGPSGRVHSWAPLVDLPWAGSEKQIAGDTWVRSEGSYTGYTAPAFRSYLSREELTQCREAEHWLHVDQPVHSPLSPLAAINSFRFALWVAAPTRVHVPLRFEETKAERTVSRLLDRFQWIEGQALEEICDEHLHETGRMLPPLHDVYVKGGRLRNAAVLTFQGCLSRQWQVAFVCFAAAAEGILGHSADRGLSQRLAADYARLTARDETDRKVVREQFRRLYGIRSAIVHGRASARHEGEITLKDLAEFSDLLRGLWRVVLGTPDARRALDGSDEERRQLLKGWTSREQS